MKRICLSLILIIAWLNTLAQHEVPDTLSVTLSQPMTPGLQLINDSTAIAPSLYQYNESFEQYSDSIGKSLVAPAIIFPGFYPGQASLFQWGSGGILAAGQTESMPGLFGRESGVLNFYQQIGKFTVNAYGTATKIGYYHGLSTQWGYGGSLTYQLNDNLSFTAFGSYATKTGISQPAILGYVGYPAFGGYANYRFGQSRFGIKAGAQSYYNLASKHWDTQPIVMPYVRMNNGAELGIDVGGILYNLFRSASNSNISNPTIAPPKLGPPPVR